MALGEHCERDRPEFGADKHEFGRKEPRADLLKKRWRINVRVDRFELGPEVGNVLAGRFIDLT